MTPEDVEDARAVSDAFEKSTLNVAVDTFNYAYRQTANGPGALFAIVVDAGLFPIDTTDPAVGLSGPPGPDGLVPLTVTVHNARTLTVSCGDLWTIAAVNETAIPGEWLETLLERRDGLPVAAMVLVLFDAPPPSAPISDFLEFHPWGYATPIDNR